MTQAARCDLIGVMSGTSLDAIDAAWVSFDHSGMPEVLDFESAPISTELRKGLLALQADSFGDLHHSQLLAIQHADETASVVNRLIARCYSNRPALRAVAVHGQTVRHQPLLGYTIQLLAGAYLAEKVGVDIIGDFRSADVACGGQGAPLVPAFHQTVFAGEEARAVINIGGIANISLLVPDEAVRGYDTGPGNLLMDAWIAKHQGKAFDDAGSWARQGRLHQGLFDALRSENYFIRPAPKSTGRELFNLDWLEARLQALGEPIAAVDVQRSLLELTAWSIARACEDTGIRKLWVCGGGAKNTFLMEAMRSRMDFSVLSTEALNIHPLQVEACAFAWLGYRFLNRLSSNLPEVTGSRRTKVLGALWPAS